MASAASATCSVAYFLETLCLSSIDSSWLGCAVELAVLVYSFAAVAIVSDVHLVSSLETLCVRWHVREDVAGASFMAFGSAAPEIIINAIQSVKGGQDDTDLGIGGIVGSGMIAFTVIPGICGLCSNQTLLLKRRPIARDVGFYSLALLILCRAFADGIVQLHEAGAMVALYFVYLLVVVFASSVRQLYRVNYLGRAPRVRTSFVTTAADDEAPTATLEPLSYAASGEKGDGGGGGGGGPFGLAPGGQAVMTVVATPLRSKEPMEPGGWEPQQVPVSPLDFAHHELLATSLAKPPPPPAPAPTTCLGKLRSGAATAWSLSLRPLVCALGVTCPECAHDGPGASCYPVTCVTSFCWVALLSTVISAVVSRWGQLLGVPPSFLGMYIVAVGAEIPDTIQSVSVAKRGYGSMAVGNSSGSQIINILIGLGLPWTLSCLADRPIIVGHHAQMQVMAYFQATNVAFFTTIVLLTTVRTWRRGDHGKATLGRRKGAALLALYVVGLCIYPFFVFTDGAARQAVAEPSSRAPTVRRMLQLGSQWHRHVPNIEGR